MNRNSLDSKPTSNRCGIYARTACASQENPVDEQINNCRVYAERNEWLVLPEYIRFDQGKSGTTIFERTGLQELLRLVEASPRPFDMLLCESVGRLSRNLSDTLFVEDFLRRRGIRLCFAEMELRSSIFRFEPMQKRLSRLMNRTGKPTTAGQTATFLPA